MKRRKKRRGRKRDFLLPRSLPALRGERERRGGKCFLFSALGRKKKEEANMTSAVLSFLSSLSMEKEDKWGKKATMKQLGPTREEGNRGRKGQGQGWTHRNYCWEEK